MSSSEQSVIQTVKLTKVYRDFWLREKVTAVADLDLDVRPREVFGLLGPNGSGKSTTIKMILGLLFPTSGKVAMFGRNPTDVAVKSRIGFLPEESYLYPFLDAYETLDFYGRLFHQNRHERRRRTEMLLDMVGLSSVAYRRVGEYSKGMQRRIGLAQALINDPDLLILDEPTSGMDPIGTRQFKDLIITLAKRGKTILLSSHLLADVEDVCDRVSILYGGRQQALGRVDELLAKSNLTQITTDTLDSATLRQVEQVVKNAGKSVVEVASPRDKLESLFLRIVTEAQRQRLTTGGAVAGGQVAEFLRGAGQEGEGVLDELVQASAPAAPAKPTQAAPVAAPPAAAEVLNDLITPASASESASASARESKPSSLPSTAPASQADLSVLDELMGGSGESHKKES